MAFFFSPIGNSSQITATGAPLNAGTITTFQAGTSTPVATYTDNAGSNPAVSLTLNTLGLPSSPVWLVSGQAVKFVVKDSLGNLIRTIDNVQGIASDGSFAIRNRLINANFSINQRAVASGVVLAAGAYGHDRWKAGAGGCTYTYAASGNDTVITITAGSLMEVIEDKNVEGGVYVLQNAGTAQARIAVNGAATSGAYAAATSASPLTSASATGNQTMTVEFTTGTVSKAQLEPGTVATPFERRPYGLELALCQRYARPFPAFLLGQAYGTPSAFYGYDTGTPMRATPTASGGTYLTTIANATTASGTLAVTSMSGSVIRFDMASVTGSPLVAGNSTMLQPPAGAMLTAEL